MSKRTQFTDRDVTVLRALSLQVRLFGQRQLADALWAGDIANARRRLSRFTELGLLQRSLVMARPLPELLSPVCVWQPGQPHPDVSQIAFRLQSRWRYRTPRSTVVFLPTEQTVNHFGGRNKAVMSAQVSHDLGVSEVWLWFYCNHPSYATAWRGENLITDSEPGQSMPDAILVDSNDEPAILIEFGGDYQADRISAFHDDAVLRGLPYQIW
ncbi:replication-relaxation family protein [Rhodopirellula bahusiensis]|uniref:Uncharacterized protein n=1 Tax=Rhodopirellula bahusiensis TaxID=2014065 RepID=A0A2G1WD47_9BACT|nr:replication-relaxation family protein [Rhodopirellula bahusiensis]PHQ36974.1 hypothetical protein CEE69_00940 [Rhodopirellula bahusiensis]